MFLWLHCLLLRVFSLLLGWLVQSPWENSCFAILYPALLCLVAASWRTATFWRRNRGVDLWDRGRGKELGEVDRGESMDRLYCVEEESIFNIKEHICMSVSQISNCLFLVVYQRRQNISGRNDSRNWISVSEHWLNCYEWNNSWTSQRSRIVVIQATQAPKQGWNQNEDSNTC